MARLEVIQVQCDRCKRVKLLPPAPPKAQPDFRAEMVGGKTLQYNDLCASCKKAIEHVWSDLEEWDREIKQEFGPKVQGEKAVPLVPAPDYTPPKPHSLAAANKK